MTNTLNEELFNGYKYMRKLLKSFSFSQYPQDLYISSLLMELVSLTRSAITILQQEVVPKRRLRQVLACLYRSNIAFESTFHEWAKHARVRDSVNLQGIFQREVTANLIKKHVTLSIPEVEKLYSIYELRGMFPNRR